MAKPLGFKAWTDKDKLTLLEGWARNGLTYVQIAKNMGIGETTLKDWRKKEPAINEALKKGREVVDFEVENALLKRALGYDYKEETYEDGILKKVVTKHMAPDTTAQIFWLKNRRPKEWRSKIEINDNTQVNKLDELLEEIKKDANS